MGQTTSIEWADSSLNLMMGCAGCELWNPAAGVRRCYAGEMTNIYKGRNGWPESFDKPKLFTERLEAALRWKDLAGADRLDKPWLNGMPRVIFLNDMGDTFTESLDPDEWLAPLLKHIAYSRHLWLLLTKRASRMAEFSKRHALPKNVWPGVSVTNQRTVARAQTLLTVKGGGVKWVSAEPLWEEVALHNLPYAKPHSFGQAYHNLLSGQFHNLPCLSTDGKTEFTVKTEEPSLPKIGWVVGGGESGNDATPCDIAWLRSLADQCVANGVPYFLKQLGSNAIGDLGRAAMSSHPKKGDDLEFPDDLLDMRHMPAWSTK